MGLTDAMRGWVWNFLMPEEMLDKAQTDRLEKYSQYRDYYEGRHKRQLKHKANQADDNLVENYAGLIVERSISMLLGDGIQFELSTDAEQDYVDEVMVANRSKILLHDAAQNAGIYGTGYIKILPGRVESRSQNDVMLPRLVVLDPRWMRILTPAEDIDQVIGYEMRFNVNVDGNSIARKEVTNIFAKDELGRVLSWAIANYQASRETGGRWEPMGEPVIWEYDFPPIIHWKNLPKANDCYGQSELEDVIELQDRINFVSSNISKIIRYHGHPKTWGRGAGLGNSASWGADEIVMVNGENGTLQNLEMQSDLESSRKFRDDLKQALFDISRTVDLSSMKDKVGQLTNFGLKVLYNDSLDKLSTKRDLFGEALLELAHRLLILDNRPGDPGQIKWPEPLPANEVEQDDRDGFDLDRELASKETIATRRGYDYLQEQDRIAAEKSQADNIGSALLKAFSKGQ